MLHSYWVLCSPRIMTIMNSILTGCYEWVLYSLGIMIVVSSVLTGCHYGRGSRWVQRSLVVVSSECGIQYGCGRLQDRIRGHCSMAGCWGVCSHMCCVGSLQGCVWHGEVVCRVAVGMDVAWGSAVHGVYWVLYSLSIMNVGSSVLTRCCDYTEYYTHWLLQL